MATINAQRFKHAMDRALIERVGLFGWYDSTGYTYTAGGQSGYQSALSRWVVDSAAGLAGHAFVSFRGQSVNDSGVSGGASGTASSGLPAANEALWPAVYSDVHQPSYLASGTNSSVVGGLGRSTSTDPMLLDGNDDITLNIWYDTLSGGGSFTPRIRLGASPFTVLHTASAIDLDATPSIQKYSHTVTGSSSVATAGLEIQMGAAAAATAPFIFRGFSAYQANKTTGWVTGAIGAKGGTSLRDHLALWQAMSATQRDQHLSVLCDELGPNRLCVVLLPIGLNDRNENQASIGPNPVSDGDSAEATLDNLRGVVNLLRESFGRINATPIFVPIRPHAVSDPMDAKLVAYQAAFETYAQGTGEVTIDQTDLISQATISAYYGNGGADAIHLDLPGYELVIDTLFAELEAQGGQLTAAQVVAAMTASDVSVRATDTNGNELATAGALTDVANDAGAAHTEVDRIVAGNVVVRANNASNDPIPASGDIRTALSPELGNMDTPLSGVLSQATAANSAATSAVTAIASVQGGVSSTLSTLGSPADGTVSNDIAAIGAGGGGDVVFAVSAAVIQSTDADEAQGIVLRQFERRTQRILLVNGDGQSLNFTGTTGQLTVYSRVPSGGDAVHHRISAAGVDGGFDVLIDRNHTQIVRDCHYRLSTEATNASGDNVLLVGRWRVNTSGDPIAS